jgi:hypothetical protein
MKSARLVISATTLATLAIWGGTRPIAQAPPVDLTGSWYGTASDFFVRNGTPDGMRVRWVLMQTGTTVSGTATTTGLHPDDGMCSSCHRAKVGTVSGTIVGSTLSLTMNFPGNNGDPRENTQLCAALFTGTAATIADNGFTVSYTGSDSCENKEGTTIAFENGTLAVARDPSITSQPASQAVQSGHSVALSAMASGTTTPSYQWYVGMSGTLTNPIEGATSSSYTTPPLTITTSYWVRATNSAGSTNSSTATITVTAYQPFADDTLTAGSSVIRAVHVTELRARIDALRGRYQLAPYSYTDPTLTAGATFIQARHITDLRAALAEAYVAAGRAPLPNYTDTPLDAAMPVRAAHIAEIRAAVIAIE